MFDSPNEESSKKRKNLGGKQMERLGRKQKLRNLQKVKRKTQRNEQGMMPRGRTRSCGREACTIWVVSLKENELQLSSFKLGTGLLRKYGH